MIWGLSFVAQKSGAGIGTFTFNGIRMLIGGIALLPVAVISHKKQNKNLKPEERKKFDIKGTLIGGVSCGLFLFVASNLQQHSFDYEIAAGKVGFITALYMILVPIAGLLFGKRPKLNVWIAVVFGVSGLYLLCVNKGDTTIGKGELSALLCAVVYTAHILTIDHFCNKVDTLPLSCTQFLVSGIISVILMFIFEKPVLSDILDQTIPLLYAGLGSCSIAFTLQIYGQKITEPAVACLLFCLESVFSVLFGWFFGDTLGSRALIGCCIMFVGVVISQLEFKSKSERNELSNAH